MRVLVCTYDLNNPASGSSLSLQNICEFFKKFGCEIVLTSNCPSVELAKSYFHGEGPDLILSHQWATGKLSMLALRLNIPFAMTIHGPGQYEQFFIQRWFPVDPVLIISSSQHTLSLLNGPREKCMVLNPIISREKACYESHTSEPPQREYYTLIGNNSRAKGGYVLKEIAKRYPDRKFLFVIKDSNIDFPSNVTVHEPTNEIWKIYHKTRILLHPSQFESFGRVTKEAQLNHIPVIATDLPGIREATLNEAHYIDFYDNLDAWCRAIDWIEENYDSEISRLNRVIQSYISDEEAAKQIYDKLLVEVSTYHSHDLSEVELEIYEALTLMSYSHSRDTGINILLEQMKKEAYGQLPKIVRYRACIEATYSLSVNEKHSKADQFARAALCFDEHIYLEAVSYVLSHCCQKEAYFEGYLLGLQYLDIYNKVESINSKFDKLVHFTFYINLLQCAMEVKDTKLCERIAQQALSRKNLSSPLRYELKKYIEKHLGVASS